LEKNPNAMLAVLYPALRAASWTLPPRLLSTLLGRQADAPAARNCQRIAWPKAFDGGLATACLAFLSLLHRFGAATVYFVASPRIHL